MKTFSQRQFYRLAILLLLVLYPLASLMAAPWAWFVSIGGWGATPWRDLVEGMRDNYSAEGLRSAWSALRSGGRR